MEIDSIYQKRKAMGMKEVTQGVDTENGEKKAKDPEKELTTQEEDRQERAGLRPLSEAGVLRRGRKSIVSSLLRGQDILARGTFLAVITRALPCFSALLF